MKQTLGNKRSLPKMDVTNYVSWWGHADENIVW